VIKNSQALFSEVETDKLLGKLMSGVIENTGAERCVLLLKRQDRFLVEATGGFSMKEQQLEISTSLGLELDKVPLPRTVINYVTTKQDTIHFDDVPQTEPWSNDPFITSAQPRSLVCTPIVHMGKMLGVLYLENSSVVAVFSKSRFWLISIICAQIGIALLNSQLFGQLSKRSAELEESNAKLNDELIERKKVQEELERAMELAKAAVVSKNQFLANMSHEIRTPLNAIIGMTGLLLDTQLTQTQQEWLSLIEVSGNALLSLVNDILDLAKMESGKVSLVMEDCNLANNMREALAMFVHSSQTKEIRMKLQIDPLCPKTIHTDKIRLRQVLLNLLSNAIKFTPSGGLITLSVKSRRVQVIEMDSSDPTTGEHTTSRTLVDNPAYGEWDEVHINVRDSGPGVGAQMINQLFQPFTQGDGSFSRKVGGTGLGLAISKQLVHLLGGDIWLDTSVTDGSSFHFTILCRRIPTASPEMGSLPMLGVRRASLVLPLPASIGSSHYLEGMQGEPARTMNSEDSSCLYEPDSPSTRAADKHNRSSEEAEREERLSSSFQPITIAPPAAAAAETTATATAEESGLPPLASTPSNANDQAVPATSQQPKNPPSLLVVEDNKTNQKLLLQLLKRLGYVADVANDGLEAVEAWHKKEYDIILMDLQMPNMDGLTATQVIMAECNRSTPQIVAVSANVYESDKAACSAAGMVDFIEKPIRMPVLKASLDRCKERGGWAGWTTELPARTM